MRLIIALIMIAIAVPAYAQQAGQGYGGNRKPAYDNVAADFINCAMYYTIAGSCIQTLAKRKTAQSSAALAAADDLTDAAKETYRREGLIGGSAKTAFNEVAQNRKAQMLAEAGNKCVYLDAFLDKYGQLCHGISANPRAYMDDRLGNLP